MLRSRTWMLHPKPRSAHRAVVLAESWQASSPLQLAVLLLPKGWRHFVSNSLPSLPWQADHREIPGKELLRVARGQISDSPRPCQETSKDAGSPGQLSGVGCADQSGD